jgi:hypothetical protein
MYSEKDLTWSSIENNYKYNKVIWFTQKNGIPVYALFDENGEKIDINIYF